jgi:hypothetical protein
MNQKESVLVILLAIACIPIYGSTAASLAIIYGIILLNGKFKALGKKAVTFGIVGIVYQLALIGFVL